MFQNQHQQSENEVVPMRQQRQRPNYDVGAEGGQPNPSLALRLRKCKSRKSSKPKICRSKHDEPLLDISRRIYYKQPNRCEGGRGRNNNLGSWMTSWISVIKGEIWEEKGNITLKQLPSTNQWIATWGMGWKQLRRTGSMTNSGRGPIHIGNGRRCQKKKKKKSNSCWTASPRQFNRRLQSSKTAITVFLKDIMGETLQDHHTSVGRPICNLSFADDIDLMAGTNS